MNNRSIALAIAALSTAQITTADAQSVYVAPGGVYIASGTVYVIPPPSNGNGSYIEPIYDYGNGYGYGNGVLEPAPYPAPVVAAPGSGYVVTRYGPNGNGYALRLPQRLRPPAAAGLSQRRSGMEQLRLGARGAGAGSELLQRQRN